jgi:hypothetical protein
VPPGCLTEHGAKLMTLFTIGPQTHFARSGDVVNVTASKQGAAIGEIDCLVLRHCGNELSYRKCALHELPLWPGDHYCTSRTETQYLST